ncbi:MAG: 30S ribosomal protein S20 [bacterium ADurb.BinA186]|nr:MAG: 30S ribosomal protein S20 [bacterium ADurb.BinA186]
MPIKKSAKKTLRLSHDRKAYNDLTRAKVKGALKGAKLAIAKNEKDADKKIAAAYRELDIASKKNVIHKNKAARLKSRLAKASSAK